MTGPEIHFTSLGIVMMAGKGRNRVGNGKIGATRSTDRRQHAR